MAEQELRFNIVVDAKTGAIRQVQQELGELTNTLGKRIPQAGQATASAFGGVANIVKGLGLASVLQGAASAAFKSSQSMQEFKDQLDITADAIVDDLEPALAVVSKGLQGLLIIVGGLGGFVSNITKGIMGQISGIASAITNMLAAALLGLQGDIGGAVEAGKQALKDASGALTQWVDQDWKGAADRMVGAWGAGMDRIDGKTTVTLAKQLDLLMANTKAQVADVMKSGKERLAIIDAAEKEAGRILQASAKYQTGTQLEKETLMAQQRAEFAAMRKRLLSSDMREEQSLQEEKLNAELEAIRQATEEKMTLEADTAAQREELIAERLTAELELLRSYRDQGLIDQAAYETKVVQVSAKAAGDRGKVRLEEAKATRKAQEAFFQAAIQASAGAAAQELLQTRNAGRAARAAGAEALKNMANQASTAIAVKGAEATAKSYANAGGFPLGIPAAIATMAFYTGLAALVSAAGGAAAQAMAPPSAGGGGGGGGGEEAAGTTGTTSGTTLAAGAAASSGKDRELIVVNISTLDGKIPDETLVRIEEALGRRDRS
jgi:hypothetical protein